MKKRIAKLRELLAGKDVEGMLVTNPYNRRYLTGFTGTAGVALITQQEAVFITDFRYKDQAEKEAECYTVVLHSGKIEEQLVKECERLNIKRLGFEQDHLSYGQYLELNKGMKEADCKLIPLSGMVESLRITKDERELNRIRQAVAIVDRTYEYILNWIRPGMTEREVSHEIERHMRSQGATSSSFDIIVASGERSALPHGVASQKVIQKGELVTLDFGAYYEGYCSDMTRTFAIGEPHPRLKEIYAICLEAQKKGVAAIKPGQTGREIDAVCRQLIASRGYGEQFGHSTGHGIGLEVHEGPVLSPRSQTELKAGMVVTVEPGIYLSGLGGVRIEDDVLITDQGYEVLTRSPKELVIIE